MLKNGQLGSEERCFVAVNICHKAIWKGVGGVKPTPPFGLGAGFLPRNSIMELFRVCNVVFAVIFVILHLDVKSASDQSPLYHFMFI